MKLNLRKIRNITLVLILVVSGVGIGYWWGTHQVEVKLEKIPQIKVNRTLPEEKQTINFSLFWDVWDRLGVAYLNKESLDPREMVYGAIRGMVAALGDPYTVFLAPDDNKQTKDDLNGSFEGVGIQLGFKDGSLAVVAPLAGMPAEKMGVKAGDLILKIEDRDTTDVSLPEAVKLIRGPKGTAIKLTLLHQGDNETYEASIVRDTIVIPSVEVEFKDNIAHLRLTRFGGLTDEQWQEAIDLIVKKKSAIKGVILDLRNNPGGYLSGSVFITSEFLDSGVVVQQEAANGTRETFSVERQGKLIDIPLVVLVNEGSASASEIVAGALQDHERGQIIGMTTFGKGTIQEAQQLKDGSGLHVTTARWLLPNGQSINKNGVRPDLEIEDDLETEEDEQLERAITVLTN